MKLKTFGNRAVVLNFKDRSEDKYFIIWKFELANIISVQFIEHFQDIIITSFEITVIFKTKIDYGLIKNLKKFILSYQAKKQKYTRTLWEIPVCFDLIYSKDLLFHFKNNLILYNSFLNNFIERKFQVNHYGFLPGFFYMSGLPKKLHIPRKPSPSKLVEKGTLAIGESSVGIYPQESPGGWNKIGKTYVSFFDKLSDPPNHVIPGDMIKFISINNDELLEKLKNFSDPFNLFKTDSFEIIC